MVMLMIIVLLMVAGSIGTLTQMTVRATNEDYWESQAGYAARAGLNHALSLLSTNPNHGTDIPNTPMTGDPGLTYEVEILNNMAGPDRYAPDNTTWVPTGTVWIYSVGRVRERTESGIAAFAALVAPQRPVFNHAAYVQESLRILNGAQVLEYDPSSITPTPADDARVATNSTAANSVIVADSTVEGEVLSGVGSNPGSAIQITNSTTGAARASEEAKIISEMIVPPGMPPSGPDVVVTAFAAENPIYLRPGTFNDLIAQVGATVKLQPLDPTNQTYYFTGDIVLRYAVLEIPTNLDNPVKIYVDGNVHMVDCVVNNDTGDPVKLQIYQTGANTGGPAKTFHISSTTSPSATGASFIAAGANTNFTLDNRAVLQGALIGRNVTVENNSLLYYDVRLRGVAADGQGEMTIISEVQPPQGEVVEAYNGSTTVGTSANPPAPPPPPPAPPGIPPNNAATTTGPAPAVTTATDTTATPAVAGAVGTSTAGNAALTGGAAGTSGAGTSGGTSAGTSGGSSAAGTSGTGTSGTGTSGGSSAGTSGTGTSGTGTSGTGTSGTGTSGTGTSGTGTSGTGTSGTGTGPGIAPTLLLDSCPTTTGHQQCP